MTSKDRPAPAEAAEDTSDCDAIVIDGGPATSNLPGKYTWAT